LLLLGVAIAEAVLYLRVYALSGANKRMAGFLIVVYAVRPRSQRLTPIVHQKSLDLL